MYIDSAIAQKKEQILVLTDYRKDLIYEYVTEIRRLIYGGF